MKLSSALSGTQVATEGRHSNGVGSESDTSGWNFCDTSLSLVEENHMSDWRRYQLGRIVPKNVNQEELGGSR